MSLVAFEGKWTAWIAGTRPKAWGALGEWGIDSDEHAAAVTKGDGLGRDWLTIEPSVSAWLP